MNAESPRAIAHFDLDAFFVSVERIRDPSLDGKPLIVGWRSDRGVVAACSYETRKFGIHSAMPMRTALQLCPGAVVVPPSRGAYGHYSQMVTKLIGAQAPLYEKASIDEFYLDLTGMDKFFGCYSWAINLRDEIMRRTGLPISFALSVNKLVSKIATDTVKPNGHIEVRPGTEKAFLAPMTVEKIPMVGKETSLQLHKMGIFTIDQLARTSRDTLRTIFGKHGQLLWERSQGIDNSPVVTYQEQKSLSSENTFEADITDPLAVERELLRLNKQAGAQLRRIRKFTCCVAIKIRYADFETVTRQLTVPPVSDDHETALVITELLRKSYQRNRPVRLLGVRYTHLTDRGKQTDLFHQDLSQQALRQTLDELRAKFGDESIQSAG